MTGYDSKEWQDKIDRIEKFAALSVQPKVVPVKKEDKGVSSK